MTDTPYIFVYGTLRGDIPLAARPNASREAFALLSSGADLEGQGSCSGFLYSIAWYPGLVSHRSGRVRGEVWRMRDPRALLTGLDAYEGEDYVRDRRMTKLDDGRKLQAHVYRYTGDVTRARLIESGDYIDWVTAKDRAREAT